MEERKAAAKSDPVATHVQKHADLSQETKFDAAAAELSRSGTECKLIGILTSDPTAREFPYMERQLETLQLRASKRNVAFELVPWHNPGDLSKFDALMPIGETVLCHVFGVVRPLMTLFLCGFTSGLELP